MNASTLAVCVLLPAPRDEVFRALTDSREHSSFTGAPSEIDARSGGRFSYFGGAISGQFVSVTAPHRIEQTLTAESWPAGHAARIDMRLEQRSEGARTYVRIREDGVPEEQLDVVVAGWADYWDKLSEYLRERRLKIVREFVERYKNHHEWDSVDQYIAADCEVHIPIPGLPQGREGMRVNGKAVCAAFPDVHVTREFIATEGDLVLERAHAKATHRGELMGLPATDRPVAWTELHAYRVAGSLITAVWSEPDLLGVMAQLGAFKAPGG